MTVLGHGREELLAAHTVKIANIVVWSEIGRTSVSDII